MSGDEDNNSRWLVVYRHGDQTDRFPGNHTVDIDLGGALVVLDETREVVAAYAPAQWRRTRLRHRHNADAEGGDE